MTFKKKIMSTTNKSAAKFNKYNWTCMGPGWNLPQVGDCYFLNATKMFYYSHLFGHIRKISLYSMLVFSLCMDLILWQFLKLWSWSSWAKHPNLQLSWFLNSFFLNWTWHHNTLISVSKIITSKVFLKLKFIVLNRVQFRVSFLEVHKVRKIWASYLCHNFLFILLYPKP